MYLRIVVSGKRRNGDKMDQITLNSCFCGEFLAAFKAKVLYTEFIFLEKK